MPGPYFILKLYLAVVGLSAAIAVAHAVGVL